MTRRIGMAALALVGIAAQSVSADLSTAQLEFAFNMRNAAPQDYQGSFFYLNDSVSSEGNLVAGQIGWGVWELDKAGNVVHMMRTNERLAKGNDPAKLGNPPIGAKSVARIGNSYFLGANNHAGVARFAAAGPDAWDTVLLTDLVNIPGSTESVASNGVRLFTNESTNDNSGAPEGGGQDTLHGYTVFVSPGQPFSLRPLWTTDIGNHPDRVNPNPRFRGVAFGDNDFVYAVDTGNGGAGSVWAFDITTGAATKVTDYEDPASGSQTNFLGELNSGFGAIVHNDALFVVGTGGFISEFTLTSPTTVTDRRDWNFAQKLFDAGAAESPNVAIYGIAANGDGPGGDPEFLWISYESQGERPNRRIAGFSFVNPEPGSAILMAVGSAVLGLRRPRPRIPRPRNSRK